MKNRNLIHSDNWATPPLFYDKLNKEFNFDHDPCPLHYGVIKPDEDGLLNDWGNINYVNPPYSKVHKEAFIMKAIQQLSFGKTSVMLLPVSTSTKIYHEVILPMAREVRFVKGRIPFIGTNDKGQLVNWHLLGAITNGKIWHEGKTYPLHKKNNGQHDSMIVIFSPI